MFVCSGCQSVFMDEDLFESDEGQCPYCGSELEVHDEVV